MIIDKFEIINLIRQGEHLVIFYNLQKFDKIFQLHFLY